MNKDITSTRNYPSITMLATAGALDTMVNTQENDFAKKKKAGLNKRLIEKMNLLNNREERQSL